MASKFGDQVKALTEKYKLRQEVVFRESAQQVLTKAQVPKKSGGRMPVKDGFLRGSVGASKEGMPSGPSDPALVFSTLKIGEQVYAGWTAAYALRMEYGFQGTDSLGRTYDQAGNGFLRAAVQNWDFIVAEAVAQAKKDIP
ncbi:hypothetical protein [Pseudoxanthomonas winnipegensis]|uniref:HK97 gp10 family phage protein n=1 Tax=Pseudoxanthomonas winnipegensis TaxID=2480810 RepID=A0A4Q8L7L9_9GAMM|nr:hypothetical protein [Pseudoxanthomonas winnipegensis]RZZ81126.1 hypothetical protein EA662_19285 [Pseudoxanthomonas winnipegensis]TAA24071.1 hypothetical protein EA661_19630 [Pseudoxanthomonas winnipegensis]TBV71456.1 hypothetical protein EYC46_17645 [Pseudoxanthomonas winnipegensis]